MLIAGRPPSFGRPYTAPGLNAAHVSTQATPVHHKGISHRHRRDRGRPVGNRASRIGSGSTMTRIAMLLSHPAKGARARSRGSGLNAASTYPPVAHPTP